MSFNQVSPKINYNILEDEAQDPKIKGIITLNNCEEANNTPASAAFNSGAKMNEIGDKEKEIMLLLSPKKYQD
jgi:hypothetical protein